MSPCSPSKVISRRMPLSTTVEPAFAVSTMLLRTRSEYSFIRVCSSLSGVVLARRTKWIVFVFARVTDSVCRLANSCFLPRSISRIRTTLRHTPRSSALTASFAGAAPPAATALNTASSSASRRRWYTYTASTFSSRFTTTGWCLRFHAGSGCNASR